MECKYCGKEIIGYAEHYVNHNGEPYCCPKCCLYDLISRGIVIVGKHYTYHYGGNRYTGEYEVCKAIGSWM